MVDPVQVAVNALLEAGRPDLACTVEPNSVGRPMSTWFMWIEPTRETGLLMLKAFRLAGLSVGWRSPEYDGVEIAEPDEEELEQLLEDWKAMGGWHNSPST